MQPILMRAVICITLALVFYTIGVWWEHRAKVLRPVHLVFFWLGLIMDTIGTYSMKLLAGDAGGGLTGVHGFTGLIALTLMLIHALWATEVLLVRNSKRAQVFHKFSLVVWFIWLIPFVLGMIMGMR